MKRYPAFDPPEYVGWRPEVPLLEEFAATVDRIPERKALIHSLTVDQKLLFFKGLMRNRLHDIALKRWVKVGILTKAWLGTGEEAVTIGGVHALIKGDVVAPMIRNAGACHEMGMPLADMFRGYLATEDSPTRGRDLHIGDLRHGIIAPISHVGAVIPVTVGVALGFKLKGFSQVAMTWVGDGSTKIGDFHEGMNVAMAQQVPVVVVIQNNQVALGTRLQQTHRGQFSDYARVYGAYGESFDGNNVLDAYAACKLAVDRARAGGGPALLVADTFRMGGHATHDEREARQCFASDLFCYWGKRDPVALYEEYLVATGVASRDELEVIEADITTEVDQAAEEALASRSSHPVRVDQVTHGVYAESFPLPIGA